MADANAFEFWLDLAVDGHAACTIFGRIEMPVRPMVGERISFHQAKGSSLEFEAEWPAVGWRRYNIVSVEVDEVSHYAARAEQGLQWMSVVRAVPLNVRAVTDARVVRDILTKQIGLELDPYGLNTLDAGSDWH